MTKKNFIHFLVKSLFGGFMIFGIAGICIYIDTRYRMLLSAVIFFIGIEGYIRAVVKEIESEKNKIK